MILPLSPSGPGSLICIQPHRLAGAGKLDLHNNVVNQTSAAEERPYLAFTLNWFAFECRFQSFLCGLKGSECRHSLKLSEGCFLNVMSVKICSNH